MPTPAQAPPLRPLSALFPTLFSTWTLRFLASQSPSLRTRMAESSSPLLPSLALSASFPRVPLLPFLCGALLLLLPLSAGAGVTVAYHGGSLLGTRGPLNVYVVYYGNWNGTARGRQAVSLIDTFIRSLSPTAKAQPAPSVQGWWRTVHKYYQPIGAANKAFVSPYLSYRGKVYEGYSQGAAWNLDYNPTWAVVQRQLSSGRFPVDSAGVYLVLTSADVGIQNFCSAAGLCGWHDFGFFRNKQLVFGLVIDASACPSVCGAPASAGPAHSAGVDGTIGTLAHALAGAATNPDYALGWWSSGAKSPLGLHADLMSLCRKQYGFTIRNGAYQHNMVGANGASFLVPALFDRATQSCKLQG